MTIKSVAGGAGPAPFDPLTVGGVLQTAATRFADRPALRYGDRSANYAELFDQAVDRARGLVGLGVRPGDHVGILMPNCWDYVVLYYAANLVGATAVLLNARYRADDLAYVIPHADVSLLIVGGHARRFTDYRPMLMSIFPELADWRGGALDVTAAPPLRGLIEIGDDRPGDWPDDDDFTAAADGISAMDVLEVAAAVNADAIGMMIFSSGTTSRPKACMLTHRSLALTAEALATRFRLTPDDRVWNPLSLFHMSTMLPMAACRASGACFIGMDHFDADGAMALLKTERPTVHYAGFPTIISALVTHPDFASYDQSALRINHVVGPPDLLRRYGDLFPGAVAVNSYGLTEATGVPCYSDLDDPADLLYDTSGSLFPGMAARIVDEHGQPLPDGAAGEICIKGYGVFAGYYKDQAATAEAVTDDGWLHTGDLGRIGPGDRLIYDGRLKDMLKIGGENVAAVELESFLVTHPAVRMAQVIGVPDDRLMEVAAAFVELNPGETLDADALVRHCIGNIASYKIPRYVRFVDGWPMSATKVQKFELRRTFMPEGKIDIAAFTRATA